ncbi:FAD-dependent oxidoreductase [Methylopila henanensis]|uniref:FAD-dependent oxidoreductase n=1 Tax=Methylopila henanensis TaxID=873516 RepID=A0ABW4K778_9HYPH
MFAPVEVTDVADAFAWSGFFGESDNGLPSIGCVPGFKRCFAVMGYGGNGVTFSAVAAQLVQRAVLGLRDPDADLFAFR